MNDKIINVWLSVRKQRKHPQLIYKLASGREMAVTLSTLYKNNPADLEVAKEIYDRKRRQIALGLIDTDQELAIMRADLPLHDFERIFLNQRRKLAKLGDISPATVTEDEKSFNTLKRVMGADTRLSNINPDYVKTFVHTLRTSKSRRKTPYSNQTINKLLRTLAAAFNYALQQNYMVTNPFAEADKLKTKRPEEYIRVMTENEIIAFQNYFANAPRARWRLPAFKFALNTLCRAGSIVRARFDDIYSDSVDREEVQFIRLYEKRNTVRDVPLFPDALQAIEEMRQLAEDPVAYLAVTHRDKSPEKYLQRIRDGYIFFPITKVDTCSRMMMFASRDLLKAGKLTGKAKFHDLRDTGATRLLENGCSIETVSYMLGHSNIRTTQQHYARLTPTKAARDTRHLRTVTDLEK